MNGKRARRVPKVDSSVYHEVGKFPASSSFQTPVRRARPILHDVEGAPFKIGDRVRVVRGTDETFDPRYRGRVGTVQYFEYECGCGQTYPNDPMIGVSFLRVRTESFWKEELKRLRLVRKKRVAG